ncbi:hypothetical protein PTKIN_Ptkin11bG0064800 [Pterospermum kingtungense]
MDLEVDEHVGWTVGRVLLERELLSETWLWRECFLLPPMKEDLNKLYEKEVSEDEMEEDLEKDEDCPIIRVSIQEKRQLRSIWSKALIVKLIGHIVGYNFLVKRLKTLWQIVHTMDVIYVGHDVYMVSRLAVWVRFPNLLMEYFDDSFLMNIGRSIGKPIRVDKTTILALRDPAMKKDDLGFSSFERLKPDNFKDPAFPHPITLNISDENARGSGPVIESKEDGVFEVGSHDDSDSTLMTEDVEFVVDTGEFVPRLSI